MKKFLSNYKSTIILLVAIIVGAITGIIFQEKATILSPFGDLFLNLLLVIIVPLIFLTITTSIAKMQTPKRLGKIMVTIIGVFLLTSIISVLVGFASTYFVKLERFLCIQCVNKKYSKARYRVLSLCPLWDYRGYKSIEIRLFKATTESSVIVSYILFVLKLVAYCSLIGRSTYRDLDAIDSEKYSDKYRMHCFLNKICCSGAKYKNVRKTFLENLDGQAAWRKET